MYVKYDHHCDEWVETYSNSWKPNHQSKQQSSVHVMTLTKEEVLGATVWQRGRAFEDFEIGKVYNHHCGRPIGSADNILFATSTLQINPIYFNRRHAEDLGHHDIVIAPMLVFSIVLGLSVEDLSERGGHFSVSRS
jgi:acyl dehydratase